MFKYTELKEEGGLKKAILEDELCVRRFVYNDKIMNESLFLKQAGGKLYQTSLFRYVGDELESKMAILERYALNKEIEGVSNGNKRVSRL